MKKLNRKSKKGKKAPPPKKGKGKKGAKPKKPKKEICLDEPDDIIKPNNILSGHKGWVLDMKILDGYLYTGSDDKTIMIWDLERSKSNF